MVRRFPLVSPRKGRRLSFIAALAGAVAISVLAAPGPAGADLNVSFQCDHIGCEFPGSEHLIVSVLVDGGAVDLHGSTLVLEFDPNTANPVSVQPGSLITGAACGYSFFWLNQTAVGDSLYIDIANLGCSVDGPGEIAQIEFECAGPDTGFVKCRRMSFRDSLNGRIPATCDSTSMLCFPATPAVPSTWGRVKTMYGNTEAP